MFRNTPIRHVHRLLGTNLCALLLFALPLSATTISGTVVDEVQQPVPGAIVYVGTRQLPIQMRNDTILTGERHPRAITDAEGKFSVEVTDDGGALLLARDLEDRSGFAPLALDGPTMVRISRPGAIDVQLPGDGALEAGEELQLVAQTPPGLIYAFNVSPRQRAPYRFDNLIAGDYLLETSHQVPQVGCCFSKVTTRQVQTTLVPGDTRTVPLVSPDLPYVHGKIADATGEGLHGVWVRLIPDAEAAPQIKAGLQLASNAPAPRVWSTVSERDGSYRIDGVTPGTYTLRAFRRLAGNSSSHTFEAVEEIAVPKTAAPNTPYERNLSIDLDEFAPLSVGDPAPDIDALALDGQAVRLADLRGRIVVLHFFAAWCSPCVATIGDFNALADEFADAPVTVIGISLDETEREAKSFAESKALNHPIIYQGSWSTNALREAYRVNAIPFTVTIGPDGNILRQNLHGELLKDDVARAVAALAG